MAVVKSRHIRHDYNTWVNWEQNTVSTLCGMKTRFRLAGIPGVTEQPQFVDVNGKRYYGWCPRCSKVAIGMLRTLELSGQWIEPDIEARYAKMSEEIFPIVSVYSNKSIPRKLSFDIV